MVHLLLIYVIYVNVFPCRNGLEPAVWCVEYWLHPLRVLPWLHTFSGVLLVFLSSFGSCCLQVMAAGTHSCMRMCRRRGILTLVQFGLRPLMGVSCTLRPCMLSLILPLCFFFSSSFFLNCLYKLQILLCTALEHCSFNFGSLKIKNSIFFNVWDCCSPLSSAVIFSFPDSW